MSTSFAPFTKQKTANRFNLIAIDIFCTSAVHFQLTFHKSLGILCEYYQMEPVWAPLLLHYRRHIFFVCRMLPSDDSNRLNETINYRKWHRDVCFLIN